MGPSWVHFDDWDRAIFRSRQENNVGQISIDLILEHIFLEKKE